MDYERLGHWGELGIEFRYKEGAGTNVTKDLLTRLLHNIVRRSVSYYFGRKEHIFIFGERPLHSVICPSIADITPVYVLEHPLERKPAGEEEHSGHVDYWISYRNYSFLMELKHSYYAYVPGKPGEVIVGRLIKALSQLGNIRTDQRRELSKMDKGLIGIALEAVTFYGSSADPNFSGDLEYQDFKELFDDWMDNSELDRRVNFRSLWILDEDLIKPIVNGNSIEIYPALAFIGNVS